MTTNGGSRRTLRIDSSLARPTGRFDSSLRDGAQSRSEIERVRRIGEELRGCEIAGLWRTREGDIEAARKPLEHLRRGVSACRRLSSNVESSAEDSTRSGLGFAEESFPGGDKRACGHRRRSANGRGRSDGSGEQAGNAALEQQHQGRQ